jgi:REP element-mobilizing transposase RayT
MFECVEDFRFFQSLLAKAVRRGDIRVFAFCLMNTHFHVVLQIRRGALATTMQRIQTRYSRHFNRRYDRDGPLMKGRFGSRRVYDPAYFEIAIRYVEANAVDAKLVEQAREWPHGSACRRNEPRPPRWLVSVEGQCRPEKTKFRLDSESRAFLAERHLAGSPGTAAGDDGARNWLHERRTLADGSPLPAPVCAPTPLLNALGVSVMAAGSARGAERDELETGLLIELCGLRQVEVSELLGIARSTASGRYRRFRRRRKDEEAFRAEVARWERRMMEALIGAEAGDDDRLAPGGSDGW